MNKTNTETQMLQKKFSYLVLQEEKYSSVMMIAGYQATETRQELIFDLL